MVQSIMASCFGTTDMSKLTERSWIREKAGTHEPGRLTGLLLYSGAQTICTTAYTCLCVCVCAYVAQMTASICMYMYACKYDAFVYDRHTYHNIHISP